jgi:hypothetical protein
MHMDHLIIVLTKNSCRLSITFTLGHRSRILLKGQQGQLVQILITRFVLSQIIHRALMAMVRLGDKARTDKPAGASHSVECYLQRAARFRPDDGMVSMIYATLSGKERPWFRSIETFE